MRRAIFFAVAVVLIFPTISPAQERPSPVELYVSSGRLAEGEKAMEQFLRGTPDDASARFGLGTIQFLQAVERLAQSLYRHGALTGNWTRQVPLIRVARPAGINPDPKATAYEDVRKIVKTWVSDLAKAEATLAQIKAADVKLPLKIGTARLDFNGDGTAGEDEVLWKLYVQLNANARDLKREDAEKFVVMLDAGDVHWLRGYCHLLMGMGEMALAYDGKALFETAGHVFFAKTVTPHAWVDERVGFGDFGQGVDFTDVIAFIHMIRLPLQEPQRMNAALAHLREMVAQSRLSWEKILAETDNEQEWVPNPKQKSVIPNSPVTTEMVQAWQEFLNEADAVLTGEKLVPFWRSKEMGVNVNKVFAEPTPFDLVLWVQGTAVTPYLQKGPMSRPETWDRFMRVFRGEFIGYAIWFN